MHAHTACQTPKNLLQDFIKRVPMHAYDTSYSEAICVFRPKESPAPLLPILSALPSLMAYCLCQSTLKCLPPKGLHASFPNTLA
eukprot:6211013-Pleurochrysis_carterae.AAC.2